MKPEPSLRARALRLLSAREHSRAELEGKLARHALDAQTLAQLLDELCAKGLVSEERYVASVLHRRAARLGTARVLQELRSKGVQADALTHAAQSLRQTETVRARAVWQRKFGAPAADQAERARQMRFLASRGFAPEAIRQALGRPDDDFHDDFESEQP